MKNILLSLIILLFIQPQARALIYLDGSVGIGFGDAKMGETSATNSYTHNRIIQH